MSYCNAFILSNYLGVAMCNVQLPINFSVAIPKDRGLYKCSLFTCRAAQTHYHDATDWAVIMEEGAVT